MGYRKVKNLEADQVVKEVGTLAQIRVHVWQGGLHDYPGTPYLSPLDRNTKPGIGTSPAPESDQQVPSIQAHQRIVDILDIPGYRLGKF